MDPIPTFGEDLGPDMGSVVVSRQQIAQRVRQLGQAIAEEYRGKELTIVAVLTGSLIFVADLVRQMPIRMRIDMVGISSYPGTATRSEGPRFTMPLQQSLKGRHVLIVDDILDSGRTLEAMLQALREQEPASLQSCILLRKERRDLPHRAVHPDFFGFDVPHVFVVGYGLDYGHLYRNVPDICVLKEHQNCGEDGA